MVGKRILERSWQRFVSDSRCGRQDPVDTVLQQYGIPVKGSLSCSETDLLAGTVPGRKAYRNLQKNRANTRFFYLDAFRQAGETGCEVALEKSKI